MGRKSQLQITEDFAVDVDMAEMLRYSLQQDYHRFIRHSWHVIEPGVKFTDGMPIEAVTEHVQSLIEGNLGRNNLLVNIPPRCMKSTTISVCLTPWVWTRPEWAHLKFLYSSYSGDLSNRDSAKARLIMQSEWYNSLFPQAPGLRSDAITRLMNTKGGHRIATSVGGKGTGEGGDVIVCDDPHNALEAESETVRQSTVTWWRETMSTRGNDPKTVKRIVVMQRLHESDLSGHIISKEHEDYVHLCLPMRYEPQVYEFGARPLVRFKDKRKEGELLWPDRFGEPETKRLERNLGEYGTAGQLQQRPAPRGGGLIKKDKFRLWPAKKPMPDFTYILQSYDTALTDKTTSDDTAFLAFACFNVGKSKHVMIVDAWDEKMNYPALRKRIITEKRTDYGGRDNDQLHPPRRADQTLIEEKGSGISIIQELQAANTGVFPYHPGRADKTARVQAILPLIDAGCVWVIQTSNKSEPTEPVSWLRKAMKQWTTFPAAEHDDYVDALTQGLRYLRDIGLLDLDVLEDEEETDHDYTRDKRRKSLNNNPYFK